MHEEINARTGLLGLLGHPVAHSVSPVLQNRLASLTGLNQRYLAFDIADEEALEDAVWGGHAMGVRGFNVTVPYKIAVMDFLEEIDPAAQKIGAVNTLKWEETGWHGYNTDMPGLLRALAYDGVEISGKNVVLIGAGGAANAALCAVLEGGAGRVLILNRTLAKAEALAERFHTEYPFVKIRCMGMDQDFVSHMKETGDDWIAIQTTSVGMHPDVCGLPVAAEEFYSALSTGYDIIFNPEETAFMKKVKMHGGQAFNGLRMLLFQGIRSFEIWNDVKVDDDTAGIVLQEMQEVLAKR